MAKKNGVHRGHPLPRARPRRQEVRPLDHEEALAGRSSRAVPAAAPAPHADCDDDGLPNGVDGDDDNDLLTDTIETQIKTRRLRRGHRPGRPRGRLRVPVGARPERRRGPAAEHLAALPGQAALPEPARPLATSTRTSTATCLDARPRSTRSGSSPSPQAPPSRTLTPALLLRRRAVLLNARGADGRRRPTLPADRLRRASAS